MVSLLALIAASSAGAANDVRISQIYGGGGNSGAQFNADFVELFNNGSADVEVGGWTLSYTLTTGTFGNEQITLPAGTVIRSKGYLLVRMRARGTTGADYDADSGGPSVDMSPTAGNIALLTAAQTGTSNNCASLSATLVDKVGFDN